MRLKTNPLFSFFTIYPSQKNRVGLDPIQLFLHLEANANLRKINQFLMTLGIISATENAGSMIDAQMILITDPEKIIKIINALKDQDFLSFASYSKMQSYLHYLKQYKDSLPEDRHSLKWVEISGSNDESDTEANLSHSDLNSSNDSLVLVDIEMDTDNYSIPASAAAAATAPAQKVITNPIWQNRFKFETHAIQAAKEGNYALLKVLLGAKTPQAIQRLIELSVSKSNARVKTAVTQYCHLFVELQLKYLDNFLASPWEDKESKDLSLSLKNLETQLNHCKYKSNNLVLAKFMRAFDPIAIDADVLFPQGIATQEDPLHTWDTIATWLEMRLLTHDIAMTKEMLEQEEYRWKIFSMADVKSAKIALTDAQRKFQQALIECETEKQTAMSHLEKEYEKLKTIHLENVDALISLFKENPYTLPSQWKKIPLDVLKTALLQVKVAVDIKEPDTQNTLLHLCHYQGSLQTTNLVLKHGADLTARNAKGQTPADYASKQSTVLLEMQKSLSQELKQDSPFRDDVRIIIQTYENKILKVKEERLATGSPIWTFCYNGDRAKRRRSDIDKIKQALTQAIVLQSDEPLAQAIYLVSNPKTTTHKSGKSTLHDNLWGAYAKFKMSVIHGDAYGFVTRDEYEKQVKILSLQAEVAKRDDIIIGLQQSNNELHQKNGDLRQKNGGLRQKNDELQQKNIENEHTIEVLIKLNKDMRENNEKLTHTVQLLLSEYGGEKSSSPASAARPTSYGR